MPPWLALSAAEARRVRGLLALARAATRARRAGGRVRRGDVLGVVARRGRGRPRSSWTRPPPSLTVNALMLWLCAVAGAGTVAGGAAAATGGMSNSARAAAPRERVRGRRRRLPLLAGWLDRAARRWWHSRSRSFVPCRGRTHRLWSADLRGSPASARALWAQGWRSRALALASADVARRDAAAIGALSAAVPGRIAGGRGSAAMVGRARRPAPPCRSGGQRDGAIR